MLYIIKSLKKRYKADHGYNKGRYTLIEYNRGNKKIILKEFW